MACLHSMPSCALFPFLLGEQVLPVGAGPRSAAVGARPARGAPGGRGPFPHHVLRGGSCPSQVPDSHTVTCRGPIGRPWQGAQPSSGCSRTGTVFFTPPPQLPCALEVLLRLPPILHYSRQRVQRVHDADAGPVSVLPPRVPVGASIEEAPSSPLCLLRSAPACSWASRTPSLSRCCSTGPTSFASGNSGWPVTQGWALFVWQWGGGRSGDDERVCP